jgi:hypothetical protein
MYKILRKKERNNYLWNHDGATPWPSSSVVFQSPETRTESHWAGPKSSLSPEDLTLPWDWHPDHPGTSHIKKTVADGCSSITPKSGKRLKSMRISRKKTQPRICLDSFYSQSHTIWKSVQPRPVPSKREQFYPFTSGLDCFWPCWEIPAMVRISKWNPSLVFSIDLHVVFGHNSMLTFHVCLQNSLLTTV